MTVDSAFWEAALSWGSVTGPRVFAETAACVVSPGGSGRPPDLYNAFVRPEPFESIVLY